MVVFFILCFIVAWLHISMVIMNLGQYPIISSIDLLAPRRRDMSEWCIITFPDHIAWKINPDTKCWSIFSIKIPPKASIFQITGSQDYSYVNCEPSKNKIPGACSSFIGNCILNHNLTCFVYWSAFGWNLSIGWIEQFPKMPSYLDKKCDLIGQIDMFPLGCAP